MYFTVTLDKSRRKATVKTGKGSYVIRPICDMFVVGLFLNGGQNGKKTMAGAY